MWGGGLECLSCLGSGEMRSFQAFTTPARSRTFTMANPFSGYRLDSLKRTGPRFSLHQRGSKWKNPSLYRPQFFKRRTLLFGSCLVYVNNSSQLFSSVQGSLYSGLYPISSSNKPQQQHSCSRYRYSGTVRDGE